jgi:hypothetical protein
MFGRACLLPLIMFLLVVFLSAPANAANLLMGIGQLLGIVPDASEIPDGGTGTIDLGECHLDSKEHCFLEYGDGYNDCVDGHSYECKSCGRGMYIPYRPIDVYYPVQEDCRRCPSWTRNVIDQIGFVEMFRKCTARCTKQGSNSWQDLYVAGEAGRFWQPHFDCHILVGDNRQCTICDDGKYRVEAPPPVTTWNAPDRAQFTLYYECAQCPGNTWYTVNTGDQTLALGMTPEPCGSSRCWECPVNCGSGIWLNNGECQHLNVFMDTIYGIAKSDKTGCTPCRLGDSESPWFQYVPAGGTPQCLMCGAGRELAVQQEYSSTENLYKYKECRMESTSDPDLRTGPDDCCRLCPINKYRPYNNRGSCKYCPGDETARGVDNTQVARGGVSCAPCGRGFKLMHCTMLSTTEGGPGNCFERSLGDPARYWRVCVPCDENEYVLSDGKCARCDPFAPAGNPARGDRRSADDTLCEYCPACQTSTVNPFAQTLVTWPPDTQEFSATRTYQIQTCELLSSRKLMTDPDALEFVLEGTDEYKPTPASAPVPVPHFHTVANTGESSCNLRHCAEACTGYFEYAAGCGPQEGDPYVHNATTYLRLSQLNEVVTLTLSNIYGATDGWSLAPEGFCSLCTACSNGEYNSACSTVSSFALNLAAGVCTPCDVACPDAGYWKDHPRGLLGCSWPADLETTALSGHGLPQAPYTCRQCPRWIQRPVIGQDYYEMYTPEACGNTLRYQTWGFAESCVGVDCDCELTNIDNAHAGPLRTVTRCVRSLAEHLADPTADAVVVDSFRRHLSPLRPYCPPHYYFNHDRCGQFSAQSQPCAFGSTDTCGTHTYNHECCTRCAVCDVAEGRRNGPNYRDCSGATSQDTQAGTNFDNCVTGDACPTNYFRSTDSSGAASCEACSSCSAGEL